MPPRFGSRAAAVHTRGSLCISIAKHIHTFSNILPWNVNCLNAEAHDDTQGKTHHTLTDQCLPEALALDQQPIITAYDNLTRKHWFHSLPIQQFQALLTLFPKSFSPFPHGTCFLSVSNQYLASDESYHPLCAPIPRNVTLSRYTVHRGLQMASRTLTLADALFQETYICASVGNTSQAYKSRP